MALSHCYCNYYWNFNYEGSYLSGVICNIVFTAHFGRSTFQMKCSTRSDIPPITCQMNQPRWYVSSNFQMKYPDKLSDISPIPCQMKWPGSHVNSNFQMRYPDKLSDIPHPPTPELDRWHDQDQIWVKIFGWGTQISCEIYPPSADIELSRLTISHCYWNLVVKNGNFTLLLTSSGQE